MLEDIIRNLDEGKLYDSNDVALIFSVTPETVARWAKAGLLAFEIKLPKGPYRYSKQNLVDFHRENSNA